MNLTDIEQFVEENTRPFGPLLAVEVSTAYYPGDPDAQQTTYLHFIGRKMKLEDYIELVEH